MLNVLTYKFLSLFIVIHINFVNALRYIGNLAMLLQFKKKSLLFQRKPEGSINKLGP